MLHDFDGMQIRISSTCGRCKSLLTNDAKFDRDDMDKSIPPIRLVLKEKAVGLIDALLDHECNPQPLDPT